jgi:hypothetical protein
MRTQLQEAERTPLKLEEVITQTKREARLSEDTIKVAAMATSSRGDSSTIETRTNTTQLTTKSERREKSGRVKEQKAKRPAKEKKRKRDEIDDIFGF